ncbi:MAG TPA: hypothetical protein VFH47_05985 [Candidatus Thermoplasmatota archaeon]|nr:hypothetical protein [Candidatus Thermoplasmatota archaeon]
MARLLLTASIVLLAALQALAWRPPPQVDLADAARHEGQEVRVTGLVRDARPVEGGGARFLLVDGGHGLGVRTQEGGVPQGRVAVEGRLLRIHGALTLLADGAPQEVAPPPAADVALKDLAAAPAAFAGPLRVVGTVEGGHLRAHGHQARLGDGPWPRSGPVEAIVDVRYEPRCLCHVLDASEVRPWTP